MGERAVVVTGLGMLHPMGIGHQLCWEKMVQGVTPNIVPPGVIRFDRFDADDFISHEQTRRMDRASQMLTVAVNEILKDAGIAETVESMGLCISTDFGTLDSIVSFSERIFQLGPSRANPLAFPNTVLNASAGHACIVLGMKGYNNTLVGYGSLGEAYDALMLGRAQSMVAAGMEEAGPYQQQTVEFCTDNYPRPFSGTNGVWLGEGAAGICLEDRLAAQQRQAIWQVQYLGYHAGFETDEHLAGLEKSIAILLEKCGRTARDIGGIVVVGSGMQKVEARISLALQTVFEAGKMQPLVFPIAGLLGKLGGAEESFGAVCAVKMLVNQIVPALPWRRQGRGEHSLPFLNYPEAPHPFDGNHVLMVATDMAGAHQVHLFEKVV